MASPIEIKKYITDPNTGGMRCQISIGWIEHSPMRVSALGIAWNSPLQPEAILGLDGVGVGLAGPVREDPVDVLDGAEDPFLGRQ
jgi:hypothetical protein